VRNPDKKVVFFAIGFETTAPANAMLVWRAQKEGLKNVSILVSHVLVPPSIAAILQSPQNRVQGFLGPGHVCAIMGYREYEPMSSRFKVPIVITGFEPLDILQGTLMTIRQLETGRAEVENQYSRILDREGNRPAQKLVSSVFEIADRKWRGVGSIPKSGYKLRWEFREHDAEKLFEVKEIDTHEPDICISGTDFKRHQETARLPGLWYSLYSAAAAGSDHGVVGRCMCRLLCVRQASRR